MVWWEGERERESGNLARRPARPDSALRATATCGCRSGRGGPAACPARSAAASELSRAAEAPACRLAAQPELAAAVGTAGEPTRTLLSLSTVRTPLLSVRGSCTYRSFRARCPIQLCRPSTKVPGPSPTGGAGAGGRGDDGSLVDEARTRFVLGSASARRVRQTSVPAIPPCPRTRRTALDADSHPTSSSTSLRLVRRGPDTLDRRSHRTHKVDSLERSPCPTRIPP